jgi:hypothetical protein
MYRNDAMEVPMATMKEMFAEYVSLGGEKPVKAFSSKAKLEAEMRTLRPTARITRSLSKTERARLRRYMRKHNIDLHPHGGRWNSHDVTPEMALLLDA